MTTLDVIITIASVFVSLVLIFLGIQYMCNYLYQLISVLLEWPLL